MPPKSRGAGRETQRAAGSSSQRDGSSRRARGNRNGPSQPPNVYKEMLAEAASAPTGSSERPPKRRRTQGTRPVEQSIEEIDKREASSAWPATESTPEPEDLAPSNSQVAFDDDYESSSEDENWEEIDIGQKTGLEEDGEEPVEETNMQLNLDQAFSGKGKQKRKPITAADRSHRLMIHKMHLCCLLVHLRLRNKWCNDVGVQAGLRRLAPPLAVKYLNHDPRRSEFERSRAFMDGLGRICEMWRERFIVSGRGMTRSLWDPDDAENTIPPQEDTETIADIEEFRLAALNLQGSRDLGAQFFCALLRSLGVVVRLVCSLQPLPFLFSSKVKLRKSDTPVHFQDGSDSEEDLDSRHASNGPRRISKFGHKPQKKQLPKGASRVPFTSNAESRFPVQWVECWDPAISKWISVDPLVTKTIGKPLRLEPPATDPFVEMSYVMAVDDSGQFADVTRRYTSSYNSKTRKRRVNVAKKGDVWWNTIVKHYNRGWVIDRDLVDENDLSKREASEPMPKSVQDFKDHPYYVLERHLKRQEVLHPKNPVGRVTLGRADGPAEAVYKRADVKTLKSASTWYREGREIKFGQQPLKRVVPSKNRRLQRSPDSEDADEDDSTALYAYHQTQPYIPPPVVNGNVPKNGYGNLDLFVPSMLPSGACHIRYPEASRAARLLGIDYADAVTGFEFKGRQGTAVVKGIVVAQEYYDGVMAVLAGYEEARRADEEENRRLNALVLWRKFFIGLQVMARLDTYDIEGEDKEARRAAKEANEDDDDEYSAADDQDNGSYENPGGGFIADDTGGGFVSEPRDGYVQEESSHNYTYRDPPELGAGIGEDNLADEDMGGGFFAEEEPAVDTTPGVSSGSAHHRQNQTSSDEHEGGGFILDDEEGNAEIHSPRLPSTGSKSEPQTPSKPEAKATETEMVLTPPLLEILKEDSLKSPPKASVATLETASTPFTRPHSDTSTMIDQTQDKLNDSERPATKQSGIDLVKRNRSASHSVSVSSGGRPEASPGAAGDLTPQLDSADNNHNIKTEKHVEIQDGLEEDDDNEDEEMYDSDAENEGLDFLL